MQSRHAITAFVDAHPQWKHMKDRLQAKNHDGWQYITLDSLEIGRVKQEGRNIFAELLIGYSELGY